MYQSVDEKAYTWGLNPYGQLGINSTTSKSTPVQPTENSTNVFRIGAGYNNTYITLIALPISLIILKIKKSHEIPFGPFLAISAIILYLLQIDFNSILNFLSVL